MSLSQDSATAAAYGYSLSSLRTPPRKAHRGTNKSPASMFRDIDVMEDCSEDNELSVYSMKRGSIHAHLAGFPASVGPGLAWGLGRTGLIKRPTPAV